MKCDEKTNGNQVSFSNISLIFYRAYQTRMIVLKFLIAYIIFNDKHKMTISKFKVHKYIITKYIIHVEINTLLQIRRIYFYLTVLTRL